MARTVILGLLVAGMMIGVPGVVGEEAPDEDKDCTSENPEYQPVMDAMCDIVEIASACQLKHTVDNPLSNTNPPKVQDGFVKVWIPIGAGSSHFIDDNVFGPLGLGDKKEWIDHTIESKSSQVVWVVSVAGSNSKADCSL